MFTCSLSSVFQAPSAGVAGVLCCRWVPLQGASLCWGSLPAAPLWSWMLCRGVCPLSQLAEVLSEEPCSSRPWGWDPPQLSPRSQGTFPPGQDQGWHRILQHPHLRPGRTQGAQLQQKEASAPMTLIFPSAAVSALRGAPNKAAKTLLPLREQLPGFPSRAPASRASRILLVGSLLFGSVTLLVRGVFGPGHAGVCRPWVRAGCACPGRSRCGSSASGGYYAGC